MMKEKRVPISACLSCGFDTIRRTDRVSLGDHGFLIKCPRCKRRGRIGETLDEAVAMWNEENQRPTRQQLRERLMAERIQNEKDRLLNAYYESQSTQKEVFENEHELDGSTENHTE